MKKLKEMFLFAWPYIRNLIIAILAGKEVANM